VSSGVTLCAKNLFGATSIHADWRKNGTTVPIIIRRFPKLLGVHRFLGS
jgi:hypothetical protein